MGINMIKKLLLLFFVLLISASVFAQKSEEIRKIGRTKYYVHTVQQGHTLYAISKVYSISIEEIISANPGVEDGLSIGEEVLIPVKGVNKKEARANPPEIEDGQLVHTVVQGETLYGISKKYKVSVEELTKNNPQLVDGLQTGMKLVINQTSIPDLNIVDIEPALPDDYIKHEVRAQETLYGIAKMYNVNISDIVEINPELSEGLKEGMVLNIPSTDVDAFDEESLISTLEKPLMKESYRVAIFLPFQLNEVDSAVYKGIKKGISPVYNSYTIAAIEFYNGFMIAVDSLKSLGLSLELSVYDISDDEVVLRSLLLDPKLKEMDMFIGPFHYSSFKIMSEFAKQEEIKIVSPINHPNKLLLNNSFLLECEPSDFTQVNAVADYLKATNDSCNNLMLSDFNYRMKPLCDEFEKKARRLGLPYRSVSVAFSEREFDLIVPKNLADKLDSTRLNRIFVISNKEGYISRLFDRMNAIDTSKFAIEVYGLNAWLKINQINTRYKVKYNVTLPIAHYINYKDLDLQRFIRKYRSLHKTDPSVNGFAFLGFDIAYFHLNELLRHGSNFEQYFSLNSMEEGLQSLFQYHQFQASSGFENRALYFVRYEGYELKRVGDTRSQIDLPEPEVEIMESDSIQVDDIFDH